MTEVLQDLPPDPPPARQLTGWKEIAVHLGRGVRTVQRWEHEFGLPVRRMGRDQSESVFAFVSEVDEWLTSTSAARAHRSHNHNHNGAPDDVPAPAQGSSSIEGDDGSRRSSTPVEESAGHDSATPASVRDRRIGAAMDWRHIAVALIGLLALTYGGWRIMTSGQSPAQAAAVSAPASARIDVDTLTVLDTTGRTVWSHKFSFPLDTSRYEGLASSDWPVGILDIDGDGNREVWFVTKPLSKSDRRRRLLHLFNADGSVRWVFGFDGSATFGNKTYTTWNIVRVFQVPEADDSTRSALWVVSKELTEYPTVLHRLDVATGKPTSEYWSSGYIEEVAGGTWQGTPALFVGSCNNDMQAPSLAVLDRARATGSAPVTQETYRCTSCPDGSPLAFLVLPKPQRFSALSSAGCVKELRIGNRGDLTVLASHTNTPGGLEARGIYRFDYGLNLIGVSAGDNYDTTYQSLVRAGIVPEQKLAAVSPEQEFLPILQWTGQTFVAVGISQPAAAPAQP